MAMTTTILDGETYTEALQRRYAEEAKTDERMNITELATEAGWTESTWEGFLTKFAALVRAEREWVDLTDDEIDDAYTSDAHENTPKSFARAVIAAFKEKQK